MLFSSVLPRRTVIRLFSYGCFMAAVLLSAICVQMHLTEDMARSQNRLRRAVLAHMNEENEALRTSLAAADREAILRHANALCGYAGMTASCGDAAGEAPLVSALADTALYYSALMRAVTVSEEDTAIPELAFWQDCTDTIAEHTAALALALSDRLHPAHPTESELTAAQNLAAFSAAFRVDPLRSSAAAHPGYSFDREPTVTAAEARQTLRFLIGNAASFLGSTVTDDTHGCYLFSCQNGYAELSRCGGHLLSYAFYPRRSSNAQPHLLNDGDLAELAASFLKKASISVILADVWEDRHGVRFFSAATKDGGCVTVGIRMHDGTVVHLDAEAYYRNADGSEQR
ncbi:MAG: hypothetical protein E7604_11765 [Ruminococcaceae bacterium]|nr:hypothetical protein [Oscillospiraceae bacterium]